MQEKAINYGLKKLTSVIQNVGSQALDQLSTKIRPNKRYKTDREDLDGEALQKGGNIQEFINRIAEIANDPQKLRAYQVQLAIYAYKKALIINN